ncbi:hypothetical protein XM38_001070 [Halomicronema hongdechloris C2206]|uniref:Trypsin-co-occurring domain-containing protein n=1 Tax=Halomicronema hongdechloris C2206 TaxID=1641165 RepID=A0A1Z3HG00_9CYAN|nr:CU044_2847 family protein [Halomicronema hongdechloris]ASC69181.1 hypothetical protein XM38_001070 [Halomicronema hongdechloris C2206]
MAQLIPIQLEDGTQIYIEATEDIATPTPDGPATAGETTRTAKGLGLPSHQASQRITQSFQAIEGTIRTYTRYTLNAFRELAIAEVERVTLEFGVSVGGEAGIPYVTQGRAESNLRITVECSFKSSQQ